MLAHRASIWHQRQHSLGQVAVPEMPWQLKSA
jgi:hypothetical protein